MYFNKLHFAGINLRMINVMVKTLLSLTCIALLSGCASSVKPIPHKVTNKSDYSPERNVVVKATAGQALLTTEDNVLVERYVISTASSFSFMLGTITVGDDDLLTEALVKGKKAFCTDKNSYYDPMVPNPISISCFIDSDQDGAFESVMASPGAIFFEKKIDNSVRYEKTSLYSNHHTSNKSELIYNGVSNGQLSLTFREYLKGKLDPASIQNVTYDISTLPTKISYLAVDFEVYSVGNDGIEYKIVKWHEE